MRSHGVCIGLAMLLIFVIGCASVPLAPKPEVVDVSPRITGLDFQGLDMAFDVDVDNPYPVPIKAPRFRYGLDIQGSEFFESEAESQINLPASRVGTLTLPVRLSYTDMFSTYQGLRNAAEADYTLRGAIILPVAGRPFELPISHSGTFPILRPPSFSDIDVDIANISLTKAKIDVQAAMKNPNAFALGIQDLGYILQLGNVELGGLTATTAKVLDAGETGRLSLTGEISAANTLLNILKGGDMGGAHILPSGLLDTPYGPVKLR